MTGYYVPDYKSCSEASLRYIIRDAHEAAACAHQMGNLTNEGRYLDQLAGASDELARRKREAGALLARMWPSDCLQKST